MRWAAAVAGVLLAASILYLGWYYVPLSGVLAHRADRLVEECQKVDVFPGTEDVTIDPDLNVAFISADDRRATLRGSPVQGGIYAMALDAPHAVRRIGGDGFGPFHPHGISLWRAEDGARRLFVINHRPSGGDTVEVFDVGADAALAHEKTILLPAGSSPNDLVAIGPDSFYVTNDHGFRSGLANFAETYLMLPFSNVAFYDGGKWSTAIEGLRFANGVNVSRNGREIYVSEFYARRIDVYARDAATGALTLLRRWPVNFGPDNIEVARDGGLWIAGHDRVFDFLAHAKNPANHSPSRVIRLNPETGGHADLFVDGSGTLNASSVGAVWDRTLIVGAVFDDHVMVCPLIEIFFRTAPAYEEAAQPKAGG